MYGKLKKKIETIRSPGGKRYYNVEKYLKEQGLICKKVNKKEIKCTNLEDIKDIETKVKICYARVSSRGQKNDLERQKELLKSKYPDYILIEDIGSGINLTKRGLLKILDFSLNHIKFG